ncbi:putative cation transport regulator [Rivularia sp. PCC 7116]|uniref:ChaB family protein n=1 Tax=Rivularia sp. PCC 7116 TaxID=373994 RepID=UPI00029F0510|nr:ChaB family protein [Rivularia sp. PCC 7116]AFY56531.1 putative cation transport regulator [Rivularia sp. PCC 7116]
MSDYKAERTITAVFKQQDQVDKVIRRLLDRGVSRDHISVMGNNFQSETRISGFISKKDVIFGGLRSGAIFGSLFGSLLGLLSGVGVLFIPFVGSVVAAGPIGGALLGAASGALAGSAGAGLASVLVTLGMPKEKAAIYETRLKAGEFIVMAEVPTNKTGEISLLMESAGGEETHTSESTLPRACPDGCNNPQDLAPEVRSHLSEDAQKTFIERYKAVFDKLKDESKAEEAAWNAVHEKYEEDENGIWSEQKVIT